MNVSVNLNSFVWVKLTPRGREVYSTYKSDLGILHTALAILTSTSTGLRKFMRFQLWQLMTIFGPASFIGSDSCFDSNLIHLTNPEQETE